MKIIRPAIALAAVAAALTLAGCASSSGDSASGDKTCAVLKSEVRDISNGAQNTLAGTIDTPEAQKSAEDYLTKLSGRVSDLQKTWSDQKNVSDALQTFGAKVDAASTFVSEIPVDGSGEADADAAATATTDIQDSATKVTVVCKD